MGNKDKGIVDLGADSEYQARIAAAKSGKVPLGGAPMPPIPRFDQQPADRHQGVQNAASGARILTPAQQEELARKGQFIPGVGSGYAANQPTVNVPQRALEQAETGKMTQGENGQFANPPRAEGAGLRPETTAGLEALAKAQTEEKKDDDVLVKEGKDLEDMANDFDIDEFGNRVRGALNNKQRKIAIEARVEDMDLEDLITRGEVRQVVPIVQGKFFPTYRSVSGTEDLYIKRAMSTERGSDQYILDKFSIMNLVAGLYALNGKPLPSHLDTNGDPDQKLFDAKYKIVSKMPLAMLADLSVNYTWFGQRLQKLFVVDNIKGF